MTNAKSVFTAVTGLVLLSFVQAREEVKIKNETTEDMESEGKGIMTSETPDEHSQLLTRVIFGFLIGGGCYILWNEVGNGFQLALGKIAKYKNKNSERVDASEHTYVPSNEIFGEPTYVPSISSYSYYTYDDYYGPQSYRSLKDNESFVSKILNSINPVEGVFSLMDVSEDACKKQKICELRKAAAKGSIVGDLLKYVSSSIRSFDAYKDAMDAGDALQDCARLFDCTNAKPH